MAGEIESPVYAILKMSDAIKKIQLPDGYELKQYSGTSLPERTDRYAMKWDGEWHITVEVFRDLGLAFAAVLVLIYVLVVGWFGSFKTPLVIMAPIPLTLIGILPAHALMGAFFTATSMIGFIAGAGHHRAQFDHPSGLHRIATLAWDVAGGSGGRCGSGALPSDAANRRGSGGGRERDSVRSHFPGLGYFVDGGRSSFNGDFAHHRSGALLLESTR